MFYDDKGRAITIKREIARGGEGRLCTIHEDESVLLKLLDRPTSEHAAKITAMLHKPPRDHGIAWPTSNVRNQHGQHAGHLIPYIRNGLHVSQVYNPKRRAKVAPGCDYHFLSVLAANTARNAQVLHDRGYVIGDIGDANFLVQRDATVVLIDADSIQVPRPDGRGHYRCTVGTEEYTPPELFGTTFASIDRTKDHDNHSLAVLLFRTLMEGVHPYASKYQGPGDPPRLAEKISKGLWPYDANHRFTPPPAAPPFTMLAPAVQCLFRRAFVYGHQHPAQRPSAEEWHHALTQYHKNLRACRDDKHHSYSNHLARCPWCERATRRGSNTPPPPTTVIRRRPAPAPVLHCRPSLGVATIARPRSATVPPYRPSLGVATIARPRSATVPPYRPSLGLHPPGFDEVVRGCQESFFAIAEHPNATPALREEALHNAITLPHIIRENDIAIATQAIDLFSRQIEDSRTTPEERQRLQEHVQRCKARLLMLTMARWQESTPCRC